MITQQNMGKLFLSGPKIVLKYRSQIEKIFLIKNSTQTVLLQRL
jgi:hypothetical protein